MSNITLKDAFAKLNSLAYRSAESAAIFCKTRGNPSIELEHFIHQVLMLQDSDLHRIIKTFNLSASKIASDLQAALDRLPRGANRISGFSNDFEMAIKEAWLFTSLKFNEMSVRTGHMILGMLNDERGLARTLNGISKEFGRIPFNDLVGDFSKAVAGSPEDALSAPAAIQGAEGAAPGEASGAIAPAAMGKQEALKRFSVDLTERARTGQLDPVVGRDDEVRQVIDILMRRRQNNPILTGEAGVGKTAVVEGFAQRIAAGDVPPALKNVSVRALDLTLLQAGASMKGEFEQRLRGVIEEVQGSTQPIILFIDEAHTLIGAGGQAGQGDAANLLKPALARGTLRTIAATTWAEYKKYFEKDPALTRRFQVIQVDEPDERKATQMLRGLSKVMEKHHKVHLLDEALEAAARLSHRYIPARQLPDKAISLIDTACARVAVGQHGVPAEIEDCRRRIELLGVESEIIDRETAVGIQHTERKKEIEESVAKEQDRLTGLEEHWNQEKELVARIVEIRDKLRPPLKIPVKGSEETDPKKAPAAAAPPAEKAAPTEPPLSEEEKQKLLTELQGLQGKLAALQGESPLILPSVDAQAVASVVADWTGIPVGRMVKNEIESVLKLADTLEQRVIGQRHALDTIAKRIRTSRAGLDNPSRPVGVFMLAGPSGVGKTETALSLAESLYGGEHNLITINMSEFQEAHTVSTLKGSPPGYVGYGEGGILTEAVRRKPYSVVLLDEIEKAHSDVHELFFQVFDKGMMEDGEGRRIDFKNTVILLTSNVGSDLIMNMCKDPSLLPEPEGIAQAMRPALLKVFPAALLGRLVVVPYYPIGDEMLRQIIRLQLDRVRKRMADTHKVPFTYDKDVADLIASRCKEVESGARAVNAIITHTVLPEISREFLNRLAQGGQVAKVHVSAKDKDFAYQIE